MTTHRTAMAAGDSDPRRLFVYNGGFLTQGRVRRILQLSGWDIRLGKPGADDWVGVWGKSPTAPRGEAMAARTDAPVLRIEDTFLRSVHPGRAKEPPLGLNIDRRGVHFDSSGASDLEVLLATHPLDDTAVLNRARRAADRIRRAHLSKYNAFDPHSALPDAPYVLVIDQTRDDASIRYGGANAATFAEMLVFAQTEHPGSAIVIKGHPEVSAGYREGHFGPGNENDRIRYLADAISPWALLDGATAVYTVSSQMGFEAIFAGHKPRVFGQPFYAGWGLTLDEYPVARRERKLTRWQLFAAAMILYPTWYDPYRDRLCQLEDAIDAIEAQARAWRDDHAGYVAYGMSRWKRPFLRRFFGRTKPVNFARSAESAVGLAKTESRKLMVWSRFADDLSTAGAVPVLRVEDGFLRSSGLGAKLVAPLSLVLDDLGIYYDPGHESRLERLITAAADLPPFAQDRAERLITRLRRAGLTKYNLPLPGAPDLPEGRRILVPGQVEDDASLTQGGGEIIRNIRLLERVRADNPDAVILYKPHPDVLAGLRTGALGTDAALQYADTVLADIDPASLIDAVDAIWTMTSTLGLEALVRGKPVTCLGAPFYAGWGLTTDLSEIPARRVARPNLAGLVHACLVDYPRYLDPKTGLACPVEVALDRLENPPGGGGPPMRAWLARLQAISGIPGRFRRRP